MRVAQVNERVKEVPAQALRAMFAGIGSLLSVTDKIRKPAASAAPETVSAENVATETATPAGTAEPESVAGPETVATAETTAEPEAAAAVAAEAPAPEATTVAETTAEPEAAAAPEASVASETSVAPEASAEQEAAAPAAVAEAAPAAAAEVALPLANYDELSVASLRARLRNLSVEQLGTLIAYEKSHAGREDVVAMFERRIAKIAEG